jgi:hypothetical protein
MTGMHYKHEPATSAWAKPPAFVSCVQTIERFSNKRKHFKGIAPRATSSPTPPLLASGFPPQPSSSTDATTQS